MRLSLVAKSFLVLIDINRQVTKTYNFIIYNNYDQPAGNYFYDIAILCYQRFVFREFLGGIFSLEFGLNNELAF